VSGPPSERPPSGLDTQKSLQKSGVSSLTKYQQLVVGKPGLLALARFELFGLICGWVPGALGLVLRGKLYPLLLGSVGRGVVFGNNVVLRHPHKIHIGDNVVIDDNCVLDAKGSSNNGITLGDDVFIGRNSMLYCQDGDIHVDDRANIGSNCQVFSAKSVHIGKRVLVAAYTYLVGGSHIYDDPEIPIIDQGRTAVGIRVGDDVWLGAGVKVLDGLEIGDGAIIAAGAVVKQDIPRRAVAGGVPAKILADRSTRAVASS